MQIGTRVKIKDRQNVLFSMLGVVKEIQPPDYPWHGPAVIVATDDGRKGVFDPSVLRAA